MPAKAKVTKEMIVDAAFAIAREAGVENINARTVSKRLHCSTQPVMYHFATMEELKRTVYAKADLYHSEYLMNMKKLPKMRRQNKNADTGTYSLGGFSFILPEVQIYLRNSF